MILSVGEILADVVMDVETGNMRAHIGGAPFNVAVNAAQTGAEVAFCGRVGNDPLGRFLEKEGKKFPVKSILQKDPVSPTTIAFVSIDGNGERDFKFTRSGAADYKIEVDVGLFEEIKPTTVHLGSLMLSEPEGKYVASRTVELARKAGAVLSFDVNYREDVFGGKEEALKAYAPFIEAADVVKFSKEELETFYGVNYLDAMKELKNPLVCVTCGKDGCVIGFKGKNITVPTKPVKPVDTTGAGDAFFGAFLAKIDGKFGNLTEEIIYDAARVANEKGAEATLFEGAVKL